VQHYRLDPIVQPQWDLATIISIYPRKNYYVGNPISYRPSQLYICRATKFIVLFLRRKKVWTHLTWLPHRNLQNHHRTMKNSSEDIKITCSCKNFHNLVRTWISWTNCPPTFKIAANFYPVLIFFTLLSLECNFCKFATSSRTKLAHRYYFRSL